MNQTNNRIREETEEEFIEILEYGKNLKGEEVWTDSEKMQWLRKKIDELLKSQREEERLRSAKIVEELMDDSEHWQPIASRIMDRVIICKEDLSLIKNN